MTVVVSIGYGRGLFESGNAERARLRACAAVTDGLHMIVFTDQQDGHQPQTDGQLHLYPTASDGRLGKLRSAYRLASQLLRQYPDAIITTQDPFETGLLGVLLKRRYRRPLTIQDHTDVYSSHYWRQEAPMNRVRHYLGLITLRLADRVRVVTKRSQRALTRRGITTPIAVLPVAIDVDAFTAGHPPVSAPAPTAATFTYLTMARLVPVKNLALLLRSFYTAQQQLPHLRVHIVGQGPLQPTLQEQAAALWPTDAPVTFSPWTDDPAGMLHQADAYVLSSNYEGWGRVLLEAMAAGSPIVTTDVGAAGEVVLHEQHGLIVPVDDEDALAAALVRLATDRQLYDQCQRALAQLDWTTVPGTDVTGYPAAWLQTLAR